MSKKPEPIKEIRLYEAHVALKCGEAFQRLAKGFIPKIKLIKEGSSLRWGNQQGNLVASATNLAFSIELCLKALLLLLNLKVPYSHNLSYLYDKIPQPIRALIEEVYDTKLPDQVRQLHGYVSYTLAHGPLEKPQWNDYKKSSALPDLLARSKDLFQSWRYVFEFRPPKDNSYEFHQFEYVPLWCAAEAIRVEVVVRLRERV